MSLAAQVRDLARPKEVILRTGEDDEQILLTAAEIESNMTYLGMDDAISQLAAEVEAVEAFTKSELLLRLADCYALLLELSEKSEAEWGDEPPDFMDTLISALEFALKGDPGCNDDEENDERRRRALSTHVGALLLSTDSGVEPELNAAQRDALSGALSIIERLAGPYEYYGNVKVRECAEILRTI